MTPALRSLWSAGLLLAACVAAQPEAASAQGNSHKEQKIERKIDRKVDKQVAKIEQRRVNRVASRTTRARVLCEDGTWAYVSLGCGSNGGVASRQYHPTPRPSTQATLHANAHSAVAHAAVAHAPYANGISAHAIARCSDGTYWHAIDRANACYRHGGVAHWF